MKYLRCPLKARKGDRVQVHFDQPTRVMLLDRFQIKQYREGVTYKYRGGHREETPQQFEIYKDGEYHVIVELGGHFEKQDITASVEILPPGPVYDVPDYSPNGESSGEIEGAAGLSDPDGDDMEDLDEPEAAGEEVASEVESAEWEEEGPERTDS